MKRILLVLAVVAVMVLLFASVATAQSYGGDMATPAATPTATATATATSTATATAAPLPRTGGPPLAGPVTLVASLVLMASGVGALMLVRRRVS